MNNIHILPTDKPSLLYLNIKSSQLCRSYSVTSQGGSVSNRHIYITSDEEIKEGDWCIDDKYKQPMKYFGEGSLLKSSKKIILTTDQDLIKDGVQKLSDEFLECFVNNPSCEFVEVQKWFDGLDFLEYKIIIPKEEPKQETLEEAKSNYADIHNEVYDIPCANLHINNRELIENAIEFGAKWQQEQDKNKYSEEDLDMFRKFMIQEQNFSKSCLDVFIEQFKNK
jgi:hypothetical protein